MRSRAWGQRPFPCSTGGLPSYAFETYKPLGPTVAKHAGISGWAYWLGWFLVAPINMILASSYMVSLFGLPTGRSFSPFGAIARPCPRRSW